MTKPPGPGRCVHCLRHFESRTWDHVFPKGWYPQSTPPNLEKWQIPSCLECNSKYGRLEADLLLKIGLSLDPKDERSKGIVDKVMRSLNPSEGRSQRDQSHRRRLRAKVIQGLLIGDQIPEGGHYPGLDQSFGEPPAERTAILVSADHIERLAEKIVRGIFYIEDGRLIEPQYVMEFLALSDTGSLPFREALDRFGTKFDRGPGVAVRRAVANDDNVSSIFEIEVWGQFKMYVVVRRDEHAPSDGHI